MLVSSQSCGSRNRSTTNAQVDRRGNAMMGGSTCLSGTAVTDEDELEGRNFSHGYVFVGLKLEKKTDLPTKSEFLG